MGRRLRQYTQSNPGKAEAADDLARLRDRTDSIQDVFDRTAIYTLLT